MMSTQRIVPEVCEGIEEDLQTLLKAFRDKQSLRLIAFHEVAAEYDLQNIYAGRFNVAEYLEFAECFLRTAFVLAGPGNPKRPRCLADRVFGIYITYALYYAQASDYHVKIRCTSNDLEELREFVEELTTRRHLDAVGCVYKLVYDDAFTVSPFLHDFDPATHKRINHVERLEEPAEESIEDKDYDPRRSALSIIEDPVYKTMLRVQKQIFDLEKRYGLSDPYIVSNVNKSDDFAIRINNILGQLDKELTENEDPLGLIKQDVKDDKNEFVVKTEPTDPWCSSRSSIKEKAYRSAVTSRGSKRSNVFGEEGNYAVVKKEPDAAKSISHSSPAVREKDLDSVQLPKKGNRKRTQPKGKAKCDVGELVRSCDQTVFKQEPNDADTASCSYRTINEVPDPIPLPQENHESVRWSNEKANIES